MNIQVFWDVTLRSAVNIYWGFGAAWRQNLHGPAVPAADYLTSYKSSLRNIPDLTFLMFNLLFLTWKRRRCLCAHRGGIWGTGGRAPLLLTLRGSVKVTRQLHAPVTLTPRNSPHPPGPSDTQCIGSLVGCQSLYRRCGKKKKKSLAPASNRAAIPLLFSLQSSHCID